VVYTKFALPPYIKIIVVNNVFVKEMTMKKNLVLKK